MSTRVRDFALLVGHTWRCSSCRDALLDHPQSALVGFKLDEQQREQILKLTSDSFQTIMRLAQETGLTVRELEEAIDHPHARLRHLSSVRNTSSVAGNW